MTTALLMVALSVVLWAVVSVIAYANSPRTRAAMPGGQLRVLLAQAILLAPVFLIVPAVNIGQQLLAPTRGSDNWLGTALLSTPLFVLWCLLFAVAPLTRGAVRDYIRIYHRPLDEPPSDQA